MKQQPLYTVKPAFIPKIVGMQAVLFGFVGALAFTIAGGFILMILSMVLGLLGKISIGGIFWFCFIVGIILLPIFYYEMRRKNVKNTRFDFFKDRLNFCYYSGKFMNKKQGRLYYADIADVVRNSSFLQGMGNLETIELHAPNTAIYGSGQSFIGVAIEDIPAGKGVGEKIMDIFDDFVAEYQRTAQPPSPEIREEEIALSGAGASETSAETGGATEGAAEAAADDETEVLLKRKPVVPPSSVPARGRGVEDDVPVDKEEEDDGRSETEEAQALEPAITDEKRP